MLGILYIKILCLPCLSLSLSRQCCVLRFIPLPPKGVGASPRMVTAPGLSLVAVCMQCKQHIVTNMMLTRGQPCIETNLLGKSECTCKLQSVDPTPLTWQRNKMVLIADFLEDLCSPTCWHYFYFLFYTTSCSLFFK